MQVTPLLCTHLFRLSNLCSPSSPFPTSSREMRASPLVCHFNATIDAFPWTGCRPGRRLILLQLALLPLFFLLPCLFHIAFRLSCFLRCRIVLCVLILGGFRLRLLINILSILDTPLSALLTLILLFILLLNQFLLLFQYLQPLLIRGRTLRVMDLQLDLVEQLFRNRAQHCLQGVNLCIDFGILAGSIHICIAEDKKSGRNIVFQTQVKPHLEVFAELGWRNTVRAYPAACTSHLQFRNGE